MKKLGLALGSGGARGYAHIGALKALEEKTIEIDLITGSSIGALVGVLYSYYGSADKLEELFLDSYLKKSLGMVRPSKGGVISAEKAEEFFTELIGDTDLEELKPKVGVVATDFKSGETVLIKKGKAAKAVQASVAFPFFIEPMKEEDRVLWDGGLSSQVPAKSARKMGADRVLGVSLMNTPENGRDYEEMNPYSMGVKAIKTLQYHMTKSSLREADIIAEPKLDSTIFLGVGTLIKQGKGKEMIEAGYEEMIRVLTNQTYE